MHGALADFLNSDATLWLDGEIGPTRQARAEAGSSSSHCHPGDTRSASPAYSLQWADSETGVDRSSSACHSEQRNWLLSWRGNPRRRLRKNVKNEYEMRIAEWVGGICLWGECLTMSGCQSDITSTTTQNNAAKSRTTCEHPRDSSFLFALFSIGHDTNV